MKNRVKIVLSVFIGALLTLIDLVTKAVAECFDVRYPNGHYFLKFIRLNYTANYGIAFGIAADNRPAMIVITVVTAFLIAGIATVAFTVFRKNTPVRMTLAVIVAGALGNFIDRICLGYVRDFVDVSPLGFGVCNLADFYITFGAVALLIIIFFIGPHAVFPLTKKWREEGKRLEAEKEAKKAGLDKVASDERPSAKDASVEVEEEVVFRRGDGGEPPEDEDRG